MAFRMNKLRDFYLVVSKILQNKTQKVDPVDSVLQDRARFRQFIDATSMSGSSLKAVKPPADSGDMLKRIVDQLLKDENKKRLVEILKNMNSKHEYAQIAHALLNEILPRFNAEEYLESKEYRGTAQGELKEALKVMTFYSQKHVERAERGLKKAYYPEYVLSQMTLDEELQTMRKKVEEEPLFREVKTPSTTVKTAKQIQ